VLSLNVVQLRSYGFSGIPQEFRHDETLAETDRADMDLPAISNALLFASDVRGGTVYTTDFPTPNEMREMIQVRQ